MVFCLKKRGETKMGSEMMPADLDREGKKKFRELIDAVDPGIDAELVANYCRMYGGLIAIRSEKARQLKAGEYKSLVPGRDGALQLNPLQTGENRMVATLNRMLRMLGLAPSREDQRRRLPLQTDPPPGCTGPEPPWGWALEMALCGPIDDPPVPAPGPNATDADWKAYHAAHVQQKKRMAAQQ
jgi:phage terminase small subunit